MRDDADAARVAPPVRELLAQLAVEAAGIGTYEWDLVSDRLVWDERMQRLLGFADGEFDGTVDAFLAHVAPEDRAVVAAAVDRAVRSGGGYDLEYRVPVPGATRWVAARGRVVDDGSGSRLVGVAYDITGRVDARSRAAQVLDEVPMAFFSLDRAWRFTYVNAEAERVLVRTADELVGELVWDAFPAAPGTVFESSYRHAMEHDEPVAFEAYYPEPLDRWYEVRAWPRPDGLAVYFLDFTRRRRAQEVAEAAVARSELRARVSSALSADLEPERAVGELARLLTPGMADWCVVTVVDDEPGSGGRPRFRDVGAWHHDPALRPLVTRYAEIRLGAVVDTAYLTRALRTGDAIVIGDDATRAVAEVLRPGEARALLERLAPGSAAVFPMRARGRTVGAITLFRRAGRAGWSPEDVTQLEDLATRAALGLDNARLYRQQRRLAEGLQRSLLTDPPQSDDLEVVTRYVPAAEAAKVGGDWYDAFVQDDGATVLVIGDVVGHDLEAAATMGQVRSVLRGIAVTTGEGPAAVLERTDRALRSLRLDVYATALVARLEQTPDERAAGVCRVRWSNAGHPDPLLVTADSRVLRPGGRHDLLLGVRPEVARTEQEVSVERGTTLLLHTDGLVERRGQDLRAGTEELERTLAALVADRVDLPTLCDEVLRRSRAPEGHDDVALVAVRMHPQDGAAGRPTVTREPVADPDEEPAPGRR